ncbi:MAG: hypothetical protein EOO14_09340 [Chitinophagaceae bacterium]|nr:MAG: hypothetical protein EOO14_09340 [Chitinophagaceae bacterium]
MKKSESLSVVFLGKVSLPVLREVAGKNYVTKENSIWLFADYSSFQIPLKTEFDVILEGKSKTLVPESSILKINKVLDQFGNELDCIPLGFQTICEVTCLTGIPRALKSLPTHKEWNYNPKSLTLARHEDIKLSGENWEHLLFEIAFSTMKELFEKDKKNVDKLIVTKETFVTRISKTFHQKEEASENLFDKMLIKGFAKHLEDNEFELTH